MLQQLLKLLAAMLMVATANAGATVDIDRAGKGTVLITGANRGIGLAMVQAFGRAGYTVIGSARRPAAAAQLRQTGAEIVALDVADPASVAALATRLNGRPIDILVNNAGILSKEAADFRDVNIEKMLIEHQVNALGPMRVTQALLPNLLAGKRKVVANISSMMGSMEMNTFGCCMGYRASKAALNSFTKTLAVDMQRQGMTFVVIHPGYVKTDMNDGAGNITAEQSAAGLFGVISALDQDDNGRFYNFDGKAMPW